MFVQAETSPSGQPKCGDDARLREERKAGRGRAEDDSGENWIGSDDFENGRAAPDAGDDVEDVRYINLEVNELLSDLES